MSIPTSSWRARTAMVGALILGFAAITASLGSGGASAKGGTAKPPAGNPAPLTPPTWPAVPAPVFSTNTAFIHGFDMTGFIQQATVDTSLCPGNSNPGGTAVINGITITIPCNSVVQMPANTLNWNESIDIATAGHQSLALDGTGANVLANGTGATPYPSFEAHIVGNIVNDKHIAGLVFLSQQSVNSGQGYVTRIDYAAGELYVGSKPGAADQVRLQINDPNGRFGKVHSPDDRFSVDDENATIHSGTGYPMCVARVAPPGIDPLCPEYNRPSATVNASCRNWTGAGVTLPAAGELPVTPVGERCRNYVMVNPATLAANQTVLPDARQQAPIELGDFISYQGTLFKSGGAAADFISVHTIEDNVGLYTQPGTQPSYIAIGEFGVGSADPSLTSVNGAAQEAQDRIFIETETTDPKSPVDIYMVDIDPQTGNEINRWITPFEMTGEVNGPLLPVAGNTTIGVGGGITTANAGAQVQRDRLRATKAPTGVLGSPTRVIRAVSRSQCLPNKYILNAAQATAVPQPTWATDAANTVLPLGTALVPAIDAASKAGDSGLGVSGAAANRSIRTVGVPCLDSTPVANGLRGGSYSAPTFEYIFPENVSVGDPVVPNDFWHLGFLVNGEGPAVGPLTPTPW